ncbi:MAG: hypothetical protein HY900_14930 [Deltaproteobacteria bacterium]|nr:hypothetical protein [Deltaproteobacteria bacterium]
MSLYRVEKVPARTTLLLTDGSRLSGSVFLSDFSPTRAGPQTVVDVMTDGTPLLAFETEEGLFLVVGKDHVAALETPLEASSASGFLMKVPARLRLSGGHAVEGTLLVKEGPGIRFSDALNAAEPWIALETGRSLFWVSKAHILVAGTESQRTSS